MEVQELMLPPGDPHFLSHRVLLGPDFLSYQDRKIKDVVIMVVLCSTLFLFHCVALSQKRLNEHTEDISTPRFYYFSVLSPLVYFIQSISTFGSSFASLRKASCSEGDLLLP